MRLFGRPLIVVIMALVPSAGAVAFDKDVHDTLTGRVINQYNRCAEHLGKQSIGAETAERIARFAMMEDEKPLIPRALNWHFYDALRDTPERMPRRLLLARTHLHHIFDIRVRKLEKAIEAENEAAISEGTGRILHYIEDVVVPAHVAPIYHAAPGDSWFQRLMVKNEPDMFDSMPRRYPDQLNYDIPLSECASLASGTESLAGIMETLAENTRSKIREPLSAEADGETFERVFWQLRTPTAQKARYLGFVGYGSAGREGFNPEHDVCEANGRNVCLSFFRGRYEAMIHATVRALFYIGTLR